MVWDLSKIGAEQSPEDAEDGPPTLKCVHAVGSVAVCRAEAERLTQVFGCILFAFCVVVLFRLCRSVSLSLSLSLSASLCLSPLCCTTFTGSSTAVTLPA